jgi:cyclopropane fatty-acyl-phospholipid synthase-like methyltransferase
MSFLRRLAFEIWYIFRRPPWDSGISPPELLEFIQHTPAGRALDLGCGTGTNAITLAERGWQVFGIDFSGTAIRRARRKARTANLAIQFFVDDVTHFSAVDGPFDLILDIGCFHALPADARAAYLDTISCLLAPGGTWLLYAMRRSAEVESTFGLTEADIAGISSRLCLARRENGSDPTERPSSWFWFQRG